MQPIRYRLCHIGVLGGFQWKFENMIYENERTQHLTYINKNIVY